jgi:hypothetical protein
MRYSSQNLSDGKYPTWIHGRGWFRRSKNYNTIAHWEWLFFGLARDFAITISFGNGENGDGVLFHVCIPWLFSVFLGVKGGPRCKECRTGIAIHNSSVWIYPLVWVMESNSNDPWYRSGLCWNLPWQYHWHSTEVMPLKSKEFLDKIPGVHIETRNSARTKDVFERMRETDVVKESNSAVYDYSYTRKNGEVQRVKAVVSVERMVWRMKWWPILPFQKSRTSIWVDFKSRDDISKTAEVGEGVHSWKGGVIGCGCDMVGDETPLDTLRRMEQERKFTR